MELKDCYILTNDDISILHKYLARAFYYDELYQTTFPQETTRLAALEYFFKCYIEAIHWYCDFYYDQKDFHSCIIVFDEKRYKHVEYEIQFLKMNVKMLYLIKLVGFKNFMKFARNWDLFTSRWVKEFVKKDYYHLDLAFTKNEYKGQGYGSALVEAFVNYAKKMKRDITLETHEEMNKNFYENIGFSLMSIIHMEHLSLKQYCMLMRNKEE